MDSEALAVRGAAGSIWDELEKLGDSIDELCAELEWLSGELSRQREIRDVYYVKRSAMNVLGLREDDFH